MDSPGKLSSGDYPHYPNLWNLPVRKLLVFIFHHFYHTFAWTYDFVALLVSVDRWDSWRRQALPHLVGNKILEIGFGTGHLQLELQKRGFQTFGLDESPQMAAITLHRLREQGLPYFLTRGRAQALPFASASLDGILSTFPSEYITDKRALAEMFRVLLPSGRLVVVPMAWIGGRNLPDRLARFLFRVTGQTAEPPESLERWVISIFSQAGFEVRILHSELKGSFVMVVIAMKPAPLEGISPTP